MGGLGFEFNNLSPGGRAPANHIMNNFPISPSVANNSVSKMLLWVNLQPCTSNSVSIGLVTV